LWRRAEPDRGRRGADGGPDWDYCENGETVYNCEQPPGSLLFDNFDDDSLDPALWNPYGWGSGPTLAETGHQIQVDLPATSSDDPARHEFVTGIAGVCTLRGDFDIRVDYVLFADKDVRVTFDNFRTTAGERVC
jgi:hypothetical protein